MICFKRIPNKNIKTTIQFKYDKSKPATFTVPS